MRYFWSYIWLILFDLTILVISESYYSVIAPGLIKSNRKYTVVVTLHDAVEPATIKISLDGLEDVATQEIFLQPHETKKLDFQIYKLEKPEYMLIAEGISGIIFRNQTKIIGDSRAGPKIYIQTDKAVYKPNDLVQFRVVILDEHTKPVKIREPIRVEILDNKNNRVKQFKDIKLIHGVYTDKFSISQYPVEGSWKIKVTISGNYKYNSQKHITVLKYVLPKFSVYIKGEDDYVIGDSTIKATVYGKYTFDKYVEGTVSAALYDTRREITLQEKKLDITQIADLEFHFDNPKDLDSSYGLKLLVTLKEKNTGLTRQTDMSIATRGQRYKISVDTDSIRFHDNKPYSIKGKVTYWNGTLVNDHATPFVMQHGSKEYSAYLDANSEAIFEFEHDPNANHIFKFKDSISNFPNIFVDEKMSNTNDTQAYCKLLLKGDRPRLRKPLEIEVSSIEAIPYLVYTIVGHADIVRREYVQVPANQKSHTLTITPTIEMIPKSFIYVHYIKNGNLYYDELILNFPYEFENQISVMAPNKVRPGQEVTINLKAQRKAYVCVMAVDLSVFLLDSSYDLQRDTILNDLARDRTILPFHAKTYPGLISGVVTLTNAHYPFENVIPPQAVSPTLRLPWVFRKKFPETWIFENYEITDENTQLTLNIPDTITTWRITAFTVHEITGFSIVDGPTDIITIKSFFIDVNLPYSVKRGEVVSIPITLFNYHNESVNAMVIMYNADQEFYFIESDFVEAERGSEDQQRVQNIQVASNGIENVVFWISPNKVGEITLAITAENALSSDAIQLKLRVEPEGVVKQDNKAIHINASMGNSFSTTLTADLPSDIVADSEYISLSLSGDILVPTFENLNALVQLPTGCGEQNMVNFVPNILVLDYLRTSRRLGKEKKLSAKAEKFIERGYQQQLSFRHNNGGYSVFGKGKDKEASTWLTAYAIRFFLKAERYLSIENNIIESGLEFLSSNQRENGDFQFTGYLFQPAQQNRFGFTAFVLMTFLENQKYASKYETQIQKSLNFLNKNLDKVDEIYALSIVATALQMAKHANAKDILNKLQNNRTQMSGLTWWSENDVNREKDVEITAYILMALLDANFNTATDDLAIFQWLIAQRNERGGFLSTHDTVVGLQALVKFSHKYLAFQSIDLDVQYVAKDKDGGVLQQDVLKIDANNMLLLQNEKLPEFTRSLDIEVTGTGSALLQLSYRYNTIDNTESKHFQIKVDAKLPNADQMALDICFSYQGQNPTNSKTNMIIMEANLLSGYTSSDEHINGLLKNDIIQRIELKNSETTVVIYFEKLAIGESHCINIMSDKINDVMMQKPAAIIVYDYYNISRYDTEFYNII